MEPRSRIAVHKTGDDDLVEYMRQAGVEDAAYMSRMMGDGDCFVLLDKDDLRTPLEGSLRAGTKRRIVHVSIPLTKGGVEGGKLAPGHESKLVVVMDRKDRDAAGARLAHETRERLEQARPEQARPEQARPDRRRGMLNLGLGVAILATMSITSLAILPSPYSYAIAAGALAPVGIMLARAARRHD